MHVLFLLFSVGTICSKTASAQDPLSFKFVMFYGLQLLILGIYAIGWQKVLKEFSLTVAYCNRAVTVIWGCIWGYLLFDEKITITKIIGSVVVIAGIFVFATSKDKEGGIDE